MSTTQRVKTDLPALQQQQLTEAEYPGGSDIEQTSGNVDSDYKLPTHEQHQMHVRLTKKVHDPLKKEYVTEENVWTGSPAQYERMSKGPEKGGTGMFGEFDKVELLHDVRPSAQVKPTLTASTGGTNGSDSKKPMRSLTDAQGRYKELVGKDAPADKTFTELKEAISHFESAEGAADLAAAKAE